MANEKRRNKKKHMELNKASNPLIRHEYLDMDYIDQLDDTIKRNRLPNGEMVTDKEWLNKFVGEHNGAKLDFNNLANNIHNTKELKKSCTDKNNARQRCVYSRAKAKKKVVDVELTDKFVEDKVNLKNTEQRISSNKNIYEDYMIALLDNKDKE